MDLFHDVAMGLVHAHGKGVLHCDLKPANILLDQDGKPRLADFGQSRLSHGAGAGLGNALLHGPRAGRPEGGARRPLGRLRPGRAALLHAHRQPAPPHAAMRPSGSKRPADLDAAAGRVPADDPQTPRRRSAIGRLPGVDRALAEIVDRCLAADPHQRFPNVQVGAGGAGAPGRGKGPCGR